MSTSIRIVPRAIIALVVCGLAFPIAASAGIEFAPPVSYPVGLSPTAVALGDLDGDGDLDAVVANGSGGTLSLMGNHGDGTFSSIGSLAVARPAFVAVADFDGDGKPDIAVASDSTNVLVFLDPTGAATSEVVAAGGHPASIASGDFDGDGDVDLAVLLGGGGIRLLTNVAGHFSPGDLLAVGSALFVASADLNGDVRPDLVVGTGNVQAVSVLLNNGNGFNAPTDYGAGNQYTNFVAIGDLDGDGDQDLVAAHAPGSISTLLNDGSGSFIDVTTAMLYGRAPSVVAADFDGDGRCDAAASSPDLSAVTARTSIGDGTFVEPTLYFASGVGARFIVAGDLNGDGRPDAVTADGGVSGQPGTMSVLISGAPQNCGRTDYAAGGGPSQVAVADFNADGHPDLAAVNEDRTMIVYLTKADGTYLPKATYAIGTLSQGLAVGDYNLDSRIDILASNYSESNVMLFSNRGDGTFNPGIPVPTGWHPRCVTVADLNGDGAPDYVTANYHDAIEEGSVSVRLNSGQGGFGAMTEYPVALGPYMAAAADFDGNGSLDLVVSNYDAQCISILLNNGNGTFQHERRWPTGWSLATAIADFDHDGDNDIAVTNFKENSISVLLNDGAGGFAARTDIPVGRNPRFIQPAIIRGDRDIDLVIATAYDNHVAFLENDGQGHFSPFQDRNCAVGVNPKSVVVADLDGNGGHDLITSNNGAGTLSVLMDVAPAGSAPGPLREFKRPRALGPPVGTATPGQFALLPSRPNPARGAAIIPFEIPEAGSVELRVFDVAGRVITTLVNGPLGAGPHEARWDGTTGEGTRVHPGTYFYRLRAGGREAVRALILHE